MEWQETCSASLDDSVPGASIRNGGSGNGLKISLKKYGRKEDSQANSLA